MLSLGEGPERLRVILTRGSDWHQIIELTDTSADFDGVAPLLVFGSLAFEGVLLADGKKVDMFLSAADVATLASSNHREVTLEHLDKVIAAGKYEVT